MEVLNKKHKFAVIGLKNDPNKYVYKIYKRLLNEKYETYGVSSYIDELDGVKIYQSLSDIPVDIDVAIFVVAPQHGLEYLEECHRLNIPCLWFQPGTYNDEFLKKLEDYSMTYYLNCILRRLDDLNSINSKND